MNHQPSVISFPDPPAYYSPSSLQSIERCGRRWALTWANYDLPITDNGEYPSPDSIPNISGLVVHQSIERLINELTNAGCVSTHSADAIGVISKIGGISAIIDEEIDKEIIRISNNPRNRRRFSTLSLGVKKNRDELRLTVQMFFRRIGQLGQKQSGPRSKCQKSNQRSPLGTGVFTEVYLKSEVDKLHGSADKISIDDGNVSISDFKTGHRSDHHLDQIRMYGLMYLGDSERNPNANYVNKLELDYPNGQVSEIHETPGFWSEFREQIRKRTSEARLAIQQNPVPTNRSAENCPICPVRQHCEDFLDNMSFDTLENQQELRFDDLRIKVQSIINSRSVEAKIVNCTNPGKSDICILVDTVADLRDVEQGSEMIILNATIEINDELKSVCSMGPYTEYFLVGSY